MKIKIHMKSGKTLVQNGVKHYNYSYNNDQITKLSLDLRWWAKRSIFVSSLDLKSIEGITRN